MSTINRTSALGPANFGDSRGAGTTASSSSGDAFGINETNRKLILPETYMSGAPLSSMATWTGLQPGAYTYIWGTGERGLRGRKHTDCGVRVIAGTFGFRHALLSCFPDRTVGITLTVGNTGTATAAAATVSDTVDPAFTINGVSPGCLVSGQTVVSRGVRGSFARRPHHIALAEQRNYRKNFRYVPLSSPFS